MLLGSNIFFNLGILKNFILLYNIKLQNDSICNNGSDIMKKQYLIYADESHKKGEYFSNFYGSAMLEYNKLQKINNDLINKKKELNLFSEVKWNKVTMQYLNKYIELINYFF